MAGGFGDDGEATAFMEFALGMFPFVLVIAPVLFQNQAAASKRDSVMVIFSVFLISLLW